jgi:hypothetical protein
VSDDIVNMSESFFEICQLADRLGVSNIGNMTGCWEHAVDEHWWMAINGHASEMKCSRGATVPAFHAYIEYNGWPAGFISPNGGIIAAGAAANEDAFIAALKLAKVDARRGQVKP